METRRTALLAVALLAGAGAPIVNAATADAAPGDATVVPIQVTGPVSARFNLVVLGDGYTAADLPAFRRDLDKHLNVLWSIEPFKSYRSYVNVYAVEIESAQSGVDCDPGLDAPQRDTALDMGFWGGCNPNSVQRLLTVSNTKATAYANLVEGTSPAKRQLLAIGNSSTYGGAGGTYATASGGNALSALITPHELGHSLGGLQDEYDYYARGEAGGTYTGGEPSSLHHTLLTEAEMRAQQAKWWRWLGAPSESGGVIGRYEGGMYYTKGVWRPSKHSMMKSLGYYFDQPERERMTQRISAKVGIVQASTPVADPVGDDRVVWVEPMHPVSHALEVTWSVDGRLQRNAREPALDLARLRLGAGTHTVTATVSDPTDFVRDPAVRSSAALTQSRTWTVNTALVTPRSQAPVEFTGSTPTSRPVGAGNVVYVETTHPVDRIPSVAWAIDGRRVASETGGDLDLSRQRLSSGTHRLTARLGGQTLTWTIDARDPRTSYELSEPARVISRPDQATEYVFDGPFTMRLTPSDDQTGYVVSEFRVDGDGWHHYYGWPTDPDAPFLFTATGTNVDDLIYGNLGPDGLSLSPFAERTPGYGRHLVEYRSIDAAGNVSQAKRFYVTLRPPVAQ